MECANNVSDQNKIHTCSIEYLLNSKKFVVYKIEGKSMEPMLLPNKDIVTIRKKENENCKENDVVLYRKGNKLILHRVIQVLPNNKYVILGDNCSKKEYGIFDKDILGILVGFKHNGKHYELNDPKYQEYVGELRRIENWRIKKKFIYDIILWNIRFIPLKTLTTMKSMLKKILFANRLNF